MQRISISPAIIVQPKQCLMGKRRARATSFDAVDYFGIHGSRDHEAIGQCQDPTSTTSSRSLKRMRNAGHSINELCSNMITYVLSFLEHHEIEYFGETCTSYRYISRQSVLWTSISVQNGLDISVHTLCSLVSRTSNIHPLQDLHIYGCRKMARPDTPTSNYPYTGALDFKLTEKCCESCQQLSHISLYFASLRELTLSCVSWRGISCSLQKIISSTKTLVSLSIAHDVDVNVLVESVADNCPMLETLQFSYVNVLDFSKNACTESDSTALSLSQASIESAAEVQAHDEGRFDHPLLLPEIGRKLAHSCPLIKRICFRHYTIDEEGVQQILNLSQIEEVDFSDNESLHGLFLADIPLRWPKLVSLTMRDCTELEDEHISHFGSLLVLGGCPSLTYVDLSCQWAFFDTSLLDEAVREDLCRARRACFGHTFNCFYTSEPAQSTIIFASNPSSPITQYIDLINTSALETSSDADLTGAPIRWREDQCEIRGFGVDPEDGVDSVDLWNEYVDSEESELDIDVYLKDAEGDGTKCAKKLHWNESEGAREEHEHFAVTI